MSESRKWKSAARAPIQARYPQVTTDHSASSGRGSDQTAHSRTRGIPCLEHGATRVIHLTSLACTMLSAAIHADHAG